MKMEELNDDLLESTNWATQSLDARQNPSSDNLLEDILINSAFSSAKRTSRMEKRGQMSEEKQHKQENKEFTLLSKHEK